LFQFSTHCGGINVLLEDEDAPILETILGSGERRK
jgi:hypothetical protein